MPDVPVDFPAQTSWSTPSQTLWSPSSEEQFSAVLKQALAMVDKLMYDMPKGTSISITKNKDDDPALITVSLYTDVGERDA